MKRTSLGRWVALLYVRSRARIAHARAGERPRPARADRLDRFLDLVRGRLDSTSFIFGSLRVLVIFGSAGWLLFAPLPAAERRALSFVLLAFTGYSAFLLALLLARPAVIPRVDLPVLGADLATAFALVVLTGGMQSDLFPGFYLLTAIHAYSFGVARGVAVAGASALLCYLSVWPALVLLRWPHCALRLAFLLLVAAALGLLAERERRERSAVEALNRECVAKHDELERAYGALQRKDEALKLLLEKVVAAQEEERRRMAADLHDELGLGLSALVMGLEDQYSPLVTLTAEYLFQEYRDRQSTLDGRASTVFFGVTGRF